MLVIPVDNNERREELLFKFGEKVGHDSVLVMCLRNKIDFKCKYSNFLEQKIKEICDTLDLEWVEPGWTEIID